MSSAVSVRGEETFFESLESAIMPPMEARVACPEGKLGSLSPTINGFSVGRSWSGLGALMMSFEVGIRRAPTIRLMVRR